MAVFAERPKANNKDLFEKMSRICDELNTQLIVDRDMDTWIATGVSEIAPLIRLR